MHVHLSLNSCMNLIKCMFHFSLGKYHYQLLLLGKAFPNDGCYESRWEMWKCRMKWRREILFSFGRFIAADCCFFFLRMIRTFIASSWRRWRLHSSSHPIQFGWLQFPPILASSIVDWRLKAQKKLFNFCTFSSFPFFFYYATWFLPERCREVFVMLRVGVFIGSEGQRLEIVIKYSEMYYCEVMCCSLVEST